MKNRVKKKTLSVFQKQTAFLMAFEPCQRRIYSVVK